MEILNAVKANCVRFLGTSIIFFVCFLSLLDFGRPALSAGLSHSSKFRTQFNNRGYERLNVYGGFISYSAGSETSEWMVLMDVLYWTKLEGNKTLAVQVESYELRPWVRRNIYDFRFMEFYGALGLGLQLAQVKNTLYHQTVKKISNIESDLSVGGGIRYLGMNSLHLEFEPQYFFPSNTNKKSYLHLMLRLGYFF